ncbi:unnamed protein product, partial [marine sediment metagenome]
TEIFLFVDKKPNRRFGKRNNITILAVDIRIKDRKNRENN